MIWYRTESTVMPLKEDTTSSKIYNYVRRNITEENVDGVTWYTYEECKIPKSQWELYKESEQQSSDIDDCMVALTELYEMMEG